MSGTILIDPGKVEEYAAQIESLAGQMKVKMGEVDAQVRSLKAVWEDQAMGSYEADFTKLSESFNELMQTIPPFVENAREHAQTMRRIGLG